MRNSKKLLTVGLSVVMMVASLVPVSAGVKDKTAVYTDGHGYTVHYGVSCYNSSGGSYTSVYPNSNAYTSVYAAAALYVKNTINATTSYYTSDYWSDTTDADVSIPITANNYIGYRTESVHNTSVQFTDNLAHTTYRESFSLTALNE